MKLKRTILYYAAAVLCSTVLVSLTFGVYAYFFNIGSSGMTFLQRIQGLAVVVGSMIMPGSPAAIAGAFLLRRIMRFLHSKSLWQWVAVGAGMALLVTWVLGSHWLKLTHATELERDWFWALRLTLCAGPGFVVHYNGQWLMIPVGGITAAVLFKIDVRWAPVTGAAGLSEREQRSI